MPDYQIHIPTPEEISRTRLNAIRHPKLLALKGTSIGPVFPEDPDRVLGMRGTAKRKRPTKNVDWITHRIKRAKRNKESHKSRMRNT